MADGALTAAEIAVLLALMAEAREVSNTELAAVHGFTLTGRERIRLNDRKLVTSRRAGRGYAHELTDLGWARCREELAGPVPERGGVAAGALHAVLAGLGRYLDRSSLALADVFRPSTVEADVPGAVRSAYAGLAARAGAEVGLADLRARLGDTPRDEVDAALGALARAGEVTLIPEDKRSTLTPRDRAA